MERSRRFRCRNDDETCRPFGNFLTDLPSLPATAAPFVCHNAVLLHVDKDGLISRCEEYYSKAFADVDAVEHYPPTPVGGRPLPTP